MKNATTADLAILATTFSEPLEKPAEAPAEFSLDGLPPQIHIPAAPKPPTPPKAYDQRLSDAYDKKWINKTVAG